MLKFQCCTHHVSMLYLLLLHLRLRLKDIWYAQHWIPNILLAKRVGYFFVRGGRRNMWKCNHLYLICRWWQCDNQNDSRSPLISTSGGHTHSTFVWRYGNLIIIIIVRSNVFPSHANRIFPRRFSTASANALGCLLWILKRQFVFISITLKLFANA